MVKGRYQNIIGHKINVLSTPMEPDEIKEFDVPKLARRPNTNATALNGKKYWEVSRWQEIQNLTKQGYLKVVTNEKKKEAPTTA